MKHKLQLLLCFLFLGVNAFSQNIPSYVPTNGLVGWWPFNGNANDESGNGNHGTVNGATLTSDRNGVANKAFSFNGSSILIPLNQSIVEMSSRTIALWFRSNGNQWGGRLFEATNVSWGCALYNSNKIGCWYQKSNQAYNAVNLSFTNHNEWYSLIYVCDSINQIVKAYLNGNLIYNSIPVTHSGSPNAWQGHFLKIGIGISNEVFNGTIDDIAIYNRALTQAEITALYNGPTYTINASSGSNGSITPSGITTLNSTAKQRYTFTANSGYILDSVIVDGTKVDSLQGYTFSNVSAHHSIRVTYKALNIPSYVPSNGLVGWWPFNGNANDESGNGNHGTVNGATLTSDRNGAAGKAYSFDGVNDNIIVNDNDNLDLINDFTVSSWFNLSSNNSSGGINMILAKRSNNIPDINGAFGGYGIWDVNDGSGRQVVCLQASSNAGTQNYPSSNGDVHKDKWYHFVASYNKSNDTLKYFLDGQVVFSKRLPLGIVNTIYNLSIGSISNVWYFFNGSLDDIAIYNRALTQQEITALYTGVVTKDIIAYSGPNGSITPIGTTTLNQGSTQSYTFTPNAGYLVDSVIVDGNKVDSIQGYTFSNISANHSIRVTFKVDSNNVSMNFPTGISYQAVARDSAGKVLANSPVKLRFSIKENAINGNTVYAETANLTTNKLGLFTCVIGNNNATYGNYKNIDWMGATKYLQVELEQGNSFVLLGTQQLLSVPYANAANTSNKSNESKKIKNASLPVYPDNNSALQGGLQAGDTYRTNAGVLMIVY